jgi:peptide/nickel transport system permease protein
MSATASTHEGYWRLVARQFRRRLLPMAGLAVVLFVGAIALAAPFLAGDVPIYLVHGERTFWFPNVITYRALQTENLYANFDRWQPGPGESAIRPPIPIGPERQDLARQLEPPGRDHWLGTDDRGRDVLSRVIWGARVSMTVGFVAVGIAILIGLLLGAFAGYYGGWIDAIVLRAIEVVLVVPAFFLILAVMALLKPNILLIMAVIGFTHWTTIARIVRGEFLKHKQQDYVTAARASGLGDLRIIFRHILPNTLGPVFVSATFGVAGAILTESALSFLGFGVPPPTASWGESLKQAEANVDSAWWLVTFPGLAIFLTVIAFNLVGEGLRDAMDPRLRE